MFCLHQSENQYYGADEEKNGKNVSLYTTKDLFLSLWQQLVHMNHIPLIDLG